MEGVAGVFTRVLRGHRERREEGTPFVAHLCLVSGCCEHRHFCKFVKRNLIREK